MKESCLGLELVATVLVSVVEVLTINALKHIEKVMH